MISQLAVFHLQHLHASECQSRHFILPKKLCIQLDIFVLTLTFTLQVQNHSVPQEHLSFGANYYKSTEVEPCCSITCLLGEKESLGPKYFFPERKKIDVLSGQ